MVSTIVSTDDENCGRFACGLVSDLSNYLERNMGNYADEFMKCLNLVLSGSYQTETKLHAMIAVGDICLAIEEQFQKYYEETMQCLFSACQVTIAPPTGVSGDDESITKLRDAIIDAFISIVHGMQGVA